jgi:hypothetical protein
MSRPPDRRLPEVRETECESVNYFTKVTLPEPVKDPA